MKIETMGTVTTYEHVAQFTVSDVPNVTNPRTGDEYVITGGRVQWNWTDIAKGYNHIQVKLTTSRVLASGRVNTRDVEYLPALDNYPQWLTELIDAHTPAGYAAAKVASDRPAGTPYSKAVDRTGR